MKFKIDKVTLSPKKKCDNYVIEFMSTPIYSESVAMSENRILK